MPELCLGRKINRRYWTELSHRSVLMMMPCVNISYAKTHGGGLQKAAESGMSVCRCDSVGDTTFACTEKYFKGRMFKEKTNKKPQALEKPMM